MKNNYPEIPKPPCLAEATCYAALLPELRAGRLAPAVQAALAAHLQRCPTCQNEAAAAADRVIAERVQQHYGMPVQAVPFLSLEDIQHGFAQADIEANAGANHTYDPMQRHTPGADTVVSQRAQQMETEDPAAELPLDWRDERPRPSSAGAYPWRTVAAATSVVALITLFALLLRGFGEGISTTGPVASSVASPAATGTATAAQLPVIHTPTPATPGQWHTVESLGYTTHVFSQTPYPQFSPVNPAIVYETTLQPNTARRSDDGGATWTPLPLPHGSAQATTMELFPSPLDAHTAFLSVTLEEGATGGNVCVSSPDCGPNTSACVEPVIGSGYCTVTFRTTDEGQTWHMFTFPIKAVLTTPTTSAGPPYAGTLLQAQGTRLYALLSGVGGRLVASADDGVTWQAVDRGKLGDGICDYAALPTGQTVFAAVSNGSCDLSNSPVLSLYRSDDGGAHWSVVGSLPDGVSLGMAARMVDGRLRLIVNLPTVDWQPHTLNIGYGATQFAFSEDGGQSWTRAPQQGAPLGSTPVFSRLLVRGDGSLVVSFESTQELYTWRPGDASWHLFAPAPRGQFSTLIRTVAPDDAELFWAVTAATNRTSGPVIDHLTVASYRP